MTQFPPEQGDPDREPVDGDDVPQQPPWPGAPVGEPPASSPYGAPPADPYGTPPANPYGTPPAYPQDAPQPGPYGAPPPFGGQPGYAPGYPPGYGPPPTSGGQPGGMGKRFLQRFLDGLVGLVILVAVAIPLGLFQVATNADTSMYSTDRLGGTAVTLLVWAAYEIFLVGSRGQTLGMMAAGLRVVDVNTGARPSYGSATVRWLILGLSWAFCFLPFLLVCLSPLFDGSGRQQGWHDLASRTMVVPA